MPDTALLVMDYQPMIVGLLDDPDPLLERVAGAIATARKAGAVIGYVRVAFTEADLQVDAPMTENMRKRGLAVPVDAPEMMVHPAVAPQAGDIVVRKTRVGSFSTTDLHEQLRAAGVNRLVLAGISTSGVVLSTVRDGFDRDYRMTVLEDGCADPSAEAHRALIDHILPRQAAIAQIDSLKTLLNA